MRWDVIGIGENSIDEVYRLPHAPEPNGKLRISSHRTSAGGQVATALCTCAALGLRAKYIGAFGNDRNGIQMRETLVERGVDVSHAAVRDCPNRHAVVLVDEQTGNRTVIWDRDPALTLHAEHLSTDHFAGARLLHVDDVDEDVAIAAAQMAKTVGILSTSDIDRVTDRTAALVNAVSIPIFSEHALRSMTGEADPGRALRSLRREHDGLLCVTLGEHGSLLLEGDRLHQAAADTVQAVDTTGAGDVFRGAFIYALLRGDAAPDMLRFANAAASLSCTREGAIDSVPSLTEVTAQLAGRR